MRTVSRSRGASKSRASRGASKSRASRGLVSKVLSKYGYHPVKVRTNRYKAISKGIRRGEAPASIMRRLVAISALTKHTLPRVSRIYKSNARWLKSKFISK